MSLDTSTTAISQLLTDYGAQDWNGNWVAFDDNLHDMVGYAANQTKFSFFVLASGQQDPNLGVIKKREQSNLGQSNSIGGDYFFIVESMRLMVLNSAKHRQLGTGVSADAFFSARQLAYTRFFNALCSRGALRLSINDKTFLLENQPFQTFSAGLGLGEIQPPNVGFTTVAGINGGANAYATNSPIDFDEGARGDPWTFAQPLVLAPSTGFKIDLEASLPGAAFPSPANIYGASANQTATVWLACWLYGQKVRPRS
jgi:hypothetical protein